MNRGEGDFSASGDDAPAEVDMQRVKVYRLNSGGTWDDRGTGLITLQHLEQSSAMGMVVCEETSPHKPLLIHRLSRENIYQQQGGGVNDDTIILWTDAEAQTDIAISFQEHAGCKHLWKQIQMEQARTKSQLGTGGNGRGIRRPMIDEMEPNAAMHEEDGREAGTSGGPVDLPPPDMRNLGRTAKLLVELVGYQKEQVAGRILQSNYIRQILDVFRSCEDLEDAESLRHLFDIVKSIIMLNDTNIMEALFSQENVMDMVGALEYDPELGAQQRYRDFLRETVVFKEVVPVRNPVVRAKIHQAYRMGYVKDVVLPRILDDATLATLSSLIMFNNVEVVLALMDDSSEFLPEVFQKFGAAKAGSEARADIVSFLSEFTNLGKSLQQAHRTAMLSKLIQLGLFEGLTQVLETGDERSRLKATDVLLSVVQHDPVPLREFLLREKLGRGALQQDNHLFQQLMQLLTSGAGGGLQEQVTEILRALLDPDSMIQDSEKNDFLQKFYDVYIGQLMGVIEAGTDRPSRQGSAAGPSAAALGLIVEMLCFCVQHHGYRIKYYVLTHGVMEKVLKLLHRRERWLNVAAIRFVRVCLSAKDEFYHRHIEKVNLLEPIITVFVANGERYNLLNSVVLEMVDYIRKENLKILIHHFMEKHFSRVEDVDYDATFVKLKDKYEQMMDNGRGTTAAASVQMHAQRIRKDDRALDRDEEEYFGEGDDDEDAAAAEPRHSNGVIEGLQMTYPLVDYADEEETQEDAMPLVAGFKRHGGGSPVAQPQPEKRGKFVDQLEPRGIQIGPSSQANLGWRQG